jgi:TorA maturation chaperone TorD
MTATLTSTPSSTREWLATAAAWRFLSCCFRLPEKSLRAELRAATPKLSAGLRKLAAQLQRVRRRDWEAEFHRVLGAGGVPACESSYDENALAGRGPLLADVRGFYEAFAYHPEKLPAEVPDHIAVELDFLAYLTLKIAFARHEERHDEAEIAELAYQRFLEQHVQSWTERFAARLAGAESPFYSAAAAAVRERAGEPPGAPSRAADWDGIP